MVHRDRIELPSLLCKSRALPLDERCKLVAGLGFEPRMAKAYETSLVTGPSPRYFTYLRQTALFDLNFIPQY